MGARSSLYRWLGITFVIAAAVSVTALTSGGSTGAAQDVPRPTLRLATGPPGGGFFPTGQSLAREYRRRMRIATIDAVASDGAVANIEAVQHGDADVAFAFADVAYFAYVGRLSDAAKPFDRLAGIALLQSAPVHLVVRAGSGIESIAGLRGRHVSVGPLRSGTALTSALLLNAFGVPPAAVHTEWLPFNDAARRLLDGTIDAMFDDAIYPADSVRVAIAAGARLLPITGPPVDRLRQAYPFFRLTVIPRNTYPGVREPVHTIGIDSLLVCRRDLDNGLVYELTSRLIESLPSLSASQDALRFTDLQEAPATPIPLHPGAARFYRERELAQ